MGTSYTYGSIEAALFLKAGTYVKAATYVQAGTYVTAGTSVTATTQLIAGTTVKAAGGLQVKQFVFKCPTGAGSVAIVGLAVTDIKESVHGARLSQAATGTCFVKTVADLTTACTIGAAKLVISNIKAMSNAAMHLIVHRPS